MVPAWLPRTGWPVAVLVVAGVGAWLDVTQPSGPLGRGRDLRRHQSAAERAVVPILSYDATSTLDQSKAAAEQYPHRGLPSPSTTSSSRADDPSERAVDGHGGKAQLVRSGIVRSGDDCRCSSW